MSDMICKRCLIRESADTVLAGQIRQMADIIPQEERAEKELTEARLDVCRDCQHLMAGVCRKCGCYVEVRAVWREKDCPDIPGRWPLQA